MARRRSTLLLSLTLLLAAIPMVGVASGSGWCQVELIAFERLGDPAPEGEFWPADPGQPDWSYVVPLQPSGPGPAVAFQRLAPKDYALGPHRWSLSRERSGVRPLMHRAWVQPIGPEAGARSVYIRSSDSVDGGNEGPGASALAGPPPRMEGALTLSRSRYLHARLDLLLRRPSAAAEGGAQTFRLRTSRRMRSGELHYIDHPAMGVLIRITPLGPTDEDPPSEADPGAAPPPG